MKAAVIYHKNGLPEYAEVAEPVINNQNEVLVSVKAAAIKHFDRSKAAGTHYAANTVKSNGRVIGGDGVCLLPNGTRVYAIGVSGMLAQKAVIEKQRTVEVPDGLSDEIAAALPNAVIGSAMALKFKADIQPGDVVLINGATGFTGRVAVQIARHYGAGKVIVTGRDEAALRLLLPLGADEAISIKHDDEFKAAIASLHAATPIDIVIDYLWGRTAEMILACLKGNGRFTNHTRYVSVGSMAGDLIQLSAANLRSVNIQLSGSGLGAWNKQQVALLFSEILPEMFALAVAGKLKADTVTVNLEDIAGIWDTPVPGGQRLVVLV